MRSSGRGAPKVDLDHLDWIEDGTLRPRPGSRRRPEARQPAEHRAQTRHRAAPGSASATREAPARAAAKHAAAERVPAKQTAAKQTADARVSRRPATLAPGPGVAERRALTLVTFLLVVYGLVMAYSASAAQAYFQYGSSHYFFLRQIVWAGIGVGAMWALSRVDYARYRRYAVPVAVVSVAALVAVLVPGVGSSINGARRWLIVGGQGLQPSEFAKLAAVLLVAALIVRRPRAVTELRGFLLLAGGVILPAAGLIMLEPDLGTTLVLVGAVVAVLIAAGAPLRYLFGLAALGASSILGLIAMEPYRMERLVTFFDPWKDQQGTGYQATQSLISIASGRVFGVGLGNSVQKFGYLPEQTTDMITGIIGEELGLIGLLVLLTLYAVLAWVCFRIALNCKDVFGKLLATGITAIVVGQACINVGAALGLLPLTGVPLPLVSCGGTSMLVVLAGLGVLHNIATNRRSHIGVSTQRRDRAAGRGGDRRTPAAGARSRG